MKTLLTALTLVSIALGSLFAPPPASAQTIEVRNRLDHAVVIYVDGEARGTVAARTQKRFRNVSAGPTSLFATSPDGQRVVASENRTLAPGESSLWAIYPEVQYQEFRNFGGLMVENHLDRPVVLIVGSVVLGTIEAGGARGFHNLSAGNVSAEVRVEGGRILRRTTLSIRADRTTNWTIG